MLRKSLILALITLLALVVFPALAQQNGFVYLYNGNSKELVRVGLDGSQTTYNLGLDANTFISSFDMTFSRDGNRVAYCAVTYPQATDQQGAVAPTARLIVQDIAAGTYLQDIDMGSAIGCRTGRYAFNENENLLAVSKINYFPGDPAADTSMPSWQLQIMDVNSGQVVDELNANSPAVAGIESLAAGGIQPYVQSFEGNQVIFAEVPYGVGGGAEWQAFQWQTDTDTVTPVERWGNIGIGRLDATGELVWAGVDPNRPAGEPGGPVPASNVVILADQSGQESVIYHSPDWVVLDARFINGGQQVAIMLLSSFDPNQQNMMQSIQWIAVDRAGQITDLLAPNANSTIADVPGGYVALVQEGAADGTSNPVFRLTYVPNGGQPLDLWTSDPAQSAYWELAWATPSEPAQGLPPFAPFAG